MSLRTFLDAINNDFDPAINLPWSIAKTPGYHTRIPDGTRVHRTTLAMDYAIALLRSGSEEEVDRAHKVIDQILSLQVTDPTDKHYGIWGWFYEEPPAQMAPADWNWADFIGSRIAQILVVHRPQISSDLQSRLLQSLHYAALSIFRRNVHTGYTNIAVMGAVVTASAGELLDVPFLRDYALIRINNVRHATEQAGGFAEFNSPTYSRILIEELERAAMLVRSPAFLESSERLRVIAWESLAAHFHPATGQLCGPQSRAYSDWITPKLAKYLTEQTGVPIISRGGEISAEDSIEFVTPLPCPPELVARFRTLPTDPLITRTRYSLTHRGETIGTAWLTEAACIGSVNDGRGWTQMRPLLGYWRAPEDSSICLRMRMLLNGIDFSSAIVHQAQSHSRILSAWYFANDAGHFHPNLDRPKDAIFAMDDLRMRFELKGRGVQARQLNSSRSVLSAGNWQAIVHHGPAEFLGRPGEWTSDAKDEFAAIDCVLYRGPKRELDLHSATIQLSHGVELLRADQSPSSSAISISEIDGDRHCHWDDLHVRVPVRSIAYG